MAMFETVARVQCVTGAFTPGSGAFITCLFNRDIKATKHTFNLAQYPSGQKSGNHVVSCYWRLEELVCNTAIGYSYDASVSDRVTIAIEHVSSKHVGMYACQMLPADDISDIVRTCNLSLKEPLSIATEPSAANCSSHSQVELENCPGVPALASLLAVAVLASFAFIVFICIRKRKPNQGRDLCELGACCRQRKSPAQEDQISIPLSQQEDDPAGGISTAGQGCKSSMTDRNTQTYVIRKRDDATQVLHMKEKYAVEWWTKEDVREWLFEKAAVQAKYKELIDKELTGAQLLAFYDTKKTTMDVMVYLLRREYDGDALKNHIHELKRENDERKKAWEKDAYMKTSRQNSYYFKH